MSKHYEDDTLCCYFSNSIKFSEVQYFAPESFDFILLFYHYV